MTDLEMVKACAEAMGYRVVDDFAGCVPPVCGVDIPLAGVEDDTVRYDPLHDDAQAMALVKKFHVELAWPSDKREPVKARSFGLNDNNFAYGEAPVSDLNRAIVTCIANMVRHNG